MVGKILDTYIINSLYIYIFFYNKPHNINNIIYYNPMDNFQLGLGQLKKCEK